MTFRPRARRLFATACLVVGAAMACDEPVRPPTTGGISIILVPQAPPAPVAEAADSSVQAAPAEASGVLALDAARVTVTGPTPKTVTSTTPTGANFDVRVEGLQPGNYNVVVEGLTSNEVTYFGTTANVTVVAGPPVSATVPFSVFVPALNDFSASTSTILTLQPTWTTVSNATGYVIQVADNAAFTNAAERTITGASATTGNYNATALGLTHVRVRALNGSIRSGPSTVRQITLNREADDTSDAPIPAVNLGFGTATITRAAFNIAPLGDVDWFTAKVCNGDSVIINARAVKLTSAPSSLNTLLDLHDSTGAGTALATNDNADSTDAEIRYLASSTQGYRVRVSAAAGAAGSAGVGHYDAIFRFVAGARNTGSVCRSAVEVTPGSPSIGALGGTQQMTARLLDSDGNEITGAAFTWNSSAQGVATVDVNGVVTAVANGSTDVTASSAGLTSPAVALTVQQVVSLVPVTPGGTTITTLGGTDVLSAQAQDANGNPVAGKTIAWASLNPAVATIDPSNGTVTAVTAGQATVSATSDGVAGYGVVTIAPPSPAAVNDWSTDASGTTQSLRGIFGLSETDAFSVGNEGTILRYNGTTWSPMTSGTTQILMGVWGSSANNVFAVGSAGTILRFNGTSWSPMTSPVTALLRGIWGAGPSAVFAVGNAGTILRFDGTTWTLMSSGTTDVLYGVWGSSATDVFAVGAGGTIIHYDGTAWTPLSSGTIEELWGVWGFSPTEVYAAGLNGTIRTYDGGNWTGMTSGTSANLRDIWGTSGADLYAVGDGGTVLRHNGSIWTALTSGTTAVLEGVWGTQAIHSVFGVGSSGTIAHGQRLAVVDHVTVTPPTPTLTAVEATVQLSAEAFDASSNLLAGRTFTWESTDEAVATVDAAGLVTAVANGTTKVIATTAGKKDTSDVTVAQVIETVEVSPPDAEVGIGSTAQFTAVGKDVNGHVVPGASFVWSTSDDQNATVDLSGLVTALNGTATITATSVNGKQGSGTVTASVVPVASVTVAPTGGTIAVSGTIQLAAETRDGANNVLTGRAIAWSSNLPNIADVDPTGLVTGFGQGNAIITATSEGISGTANITVSGTVVSAVLVTPSPSTLTAIDNTVQLSAEARDPGNNPVGGKLFTWVSQDPAIATVDADGLVTAVGAGTVNITATTDGISGNGSVTVAQTAATVEVVPATGNIAVGQSSQLSLIARDANAHVIVNPPAATWSTLDPDIATVSGSGLVGAATVGTTTITATISGQSGSSVITVVATPVATVEVTPAPTTVEEGLTVQLTATPRDAGSNALTERVVSWSSDSPNATVSATGLVTGVSPGLATITAMSEGQSGTSVVTITGRTVNSVVVTPRGATVVVPGGTQQFTAEALDNLGQVIPGKVFTWASLNTAVATVNPSNGVTSVLADGQVSISASVDGRTGYALLTAATGADPVNLWNPETNTSNTLKSVWGSSSSNIIAVGGTTGTATIRRFDGSNWNALTTAATVVLEGVWGTAADNIFAVGAGGTILQSTDGSSWAAMTSNTVADLKAVWGAGPTVVYAVGAAGAIVRYNGTVWSGVTPQTTRDLYAIWGTASNDIWAVGNEGRVLRFNGTIWTETTDGTEDLRGVWGTATNNVFTVSTAGTIRRWNGATWEPSGTTGGAALNGIHGSSGSDAYAVGASGTIMRWDGNNWASMASGTSSELFGTWNRSGRVVAVGTSGEIHRGYRGATVVVSPAGPTFATLETTQGLSAEARDAQNNPIPGRTFTWGTDNSLIADVDVSGQVTAKGAGTTAITATTGGLSGSTNAIVEQVAATVTVTPGSPTFTAFGASVQLSGEARDAGGFLIPGATFLWDSGDDLIATVNSSGLVQAVGNGPVTITATRNTAVGNASVTVAQVTASVVVTPAGAQTTGTTQAFAAEALDANGFAIAGKVFTWSGLNDAIATVDAAGVATPVASGQMSVRAEVDGTAGHGLLTVTTAEAPAINAWASVSNPATNRLDGVWGASASDVHAVGAGGTLLRWNGSDWSTPTNNTGVTDELTHVWGSSANDVYAVGSYYNGIRLLIHFNGTSWENVAGVPAGGDLHGVWGTSPTDVWAVGAGGAILHFDGTGWTEESSSPTTNRLLAVWGTAHNDVWALGEGGVIIHYNGTEWATDLSNPTAEDLYAIWGTSPTNIWAVGSAGTIIRYTGTWSPVASPVNTILQTVWGTSAGDVYAAGYQFVRFNGSDWVLASDWPGDNLMKMWGVGSSAFTVEATGLILHAHRGATLALTPDVATLAVLPSTEPLTASVNGGAVTGVPVIWSSSDPYVATVDANGVVSAVGRGRVTVTATAAGGATSTADITVTAIRVARIEYSDLANGNAADQAFGSGDLVGSIATISAAAFNAMTPEQLRENYDVLLFSYSTVDVDATWTGRLLTYLELGGGIITEDAFNVGATEFGAVTTVPGGITTPCSGGVCNIAATVPGLTGPPNGVLIVDAFNNYSANQYTAWDGALTAFIGMGNGVNPPVAGLYGRYGSGCIMFSGPVNDYHGVRGSVDPSQANHYNLILNALTWTADCPLTADPGPPASAVITPNGTTLTAFNETKQFTIQVFDAVGNVLPGQAITWESSDPTILSVDGTGLVQAIAGNGVVTVTATVTGGSNPSDAVIVNINQPANTVVVSPASATNVGGTSVFTAAAFNTNGDPLTNKVFNWNVGNTAVATMASGTATGVGSGQTWVSASVDGRIGFSLVTVTLAPSTPVNVWSHTATPGSLYGMWGVNSSNQFAVGSGGRLWRNLGAGWSAMAESGVLTTQPLYAVWGSGPNNVIAVGGNGTILRFNGTSWSAMPQSGLITNQYLYRVWGSSPNNIYAVGDAGTIIRFDGTTWSLVTHPFSTIYFWGVWGSSANDVYVSGSDGTIGHFDGSDWTTVPHGYAPGGIPFANYFYNVWGTGPEDVWASGDFGTVLHCTGSGCASGTGWTAVTGTGGGYIVNIWGTGGDEVYAMGAQGVFRYNGATFDLMTLSPASTIWAMVGNEVSELWTAGSSGRIYRGVRGAATVSITDGAPTGESILWSSNFLLAEAMTVTNKVEITTLGLVANGAFAGVKMAIYRADGLGGDPGSLIVQGAGTVTGAGNIEMAVTQTQLNPGAYWIMAIFETTTDVQCGGTTTLKYYSTLYANPLAGTFPTPISAGTYCNSNFYAKGYQVP